MCTCVRVCPCARVCPYVCTHVYKGGPPGTLCTREPPVATVPESEVLVGLGVTDSV